MTLITGSWTAINTRLIRPTHLRFSPLWFLATDPQPGGSHGHATYILCHCMEITAPPYTLCSCAQHSDSALLLGSSSTFGFVRWLMLRHLCSFPTTKDNADVEFFLEQWSLNSPVCLIYNWEETRSRLAPWVWSNWLQKVVASFIVLWPTEI